MCIFRVNAEIVTVKTRYSSTNTPLTLRRNGFPALMESHSEGSPSSPLTFQAFFKSGLLRAVVTVPSGESFQTMDRRGFRCFIIKNLSRGCLPSTVYTGALLEGRELEPNAAVREDKDVAEYLSF